MSRTVEQYCLFCRERFETEVKRINRGRGHFCSRSCSAKYHHAKRRVPNCVCAYCGIEFWRQPSSLRDTRFGLRFCCRKHKDLAQRIDGLDGFQPDQYGRDYITIAKRILPPKCNRCDYNQEPSILHTHHKDRDRSNNDISNLERLCPNCHALEHLK